MTERSVSGFIHAGLNDILDEEADEVGVWEETDSARGTGWYRARCPRDDWETSALQRIIEDAVREHVATAHPVGRLVEAVRATLGCHEHVPAVKQTDSHTYDFGCVTCHNDPDCGVTVGLGWCDTVRLLAAVHSDRPGYDESWRP